MAGKNKGTSQHPVLSLLRAARKEAAIEINEAKTDEYRDRLYRVHRDIQTAIDTAIEERFS